MKSKGLIASFFLTLFLFNALGAGFRVEGTATAVERLSGDLRSYEFMIAVQDCQWRATLIWEKSRIEAYSDGNEVYKLISGPFYYGGVPTAVLRKARVPGDSQHPILPVLWTEFASHCWFNKEKMAIFPPEAGNQKRIPCTTRREWDATPSGAFWIGSRRPAETGWRGMWKGGMPVFGGGAI